MKSWQAAYVEFRRTVELQPDNWQAQLELGRMELAGDKRRRLTLALKLVLKSNPANVEAQLLLRIPMLHLER